MHSSHFAFKIAATHILVRLSGWNSRLYPYYTFTFDFAEELLVNTGFTNVARCAFRETHSAHAQIVDLDNRERESLFVEAVK